MTPLTQILTISDLNEKGYGVAFDSDNKEYAILNALPGETVKATIYSKKKKIRFGAAEEILVKSENRVSATNSAYLATSPWEIMSFSYENEVKQNYLRKLICSLLPDFHIQDIAYNSQEFHYRNKMDFSFFFDTKSEIHYAFHRRDTKNGKIIATGSSLLTNEANNLLKDFLQLLNQQHYQFGSLKGLTIRQSFSTNTFLLALYVTQKIPDLKPFEQFFANHNTKLEGFQLIYSDRRSPAFIESEILCKHGLNFLSDKVANLKLRYGLNSFFQVNPGVFTETIKDIRKIIYGLANASNFKVGEYYAGVGTIGLAIADLVSTVTGVEISANSRELAELNASTNKINNYNLIEARTEDTLTNMNIYDLVIFDPPRPGLDQKVITSILQHKPKYILYLSCNPKTQINNLRQLTEIYRLSYSRGYNYYPKTPHVENLVLLELNSI